MTVKDYSTRSRVRSFLVCVITCGTHVTDICRETFFYRGESTTQNMLSLTSHRDIMVVHGNRTY